MRLWSKPVLSLLPKKNDSGLLRRLASILFLYLVLSAAGAVAYMLLENLDIGSAAYYGVASATGNQFGIFHTDAAKVISMVVMITEWACIWFIFETLVNSLIQGKLTQLMEREHIKKKVKKMNEHYIICGAGRVGREIALKLNKEGKKVLVIEKDPNTVEALCKKNLFVVQGDSLDENVLIAAGIKNANMIIAAFGEDADNVFLTLTAKQLNPKIRVISRAEKESTIRKLKQAGAEEVILPSVIGGKAMAEAALK